MAVESADDRALFLSTDDFGAVARYTPVAGSPVDDIPGIFDNPHIAAEFGGAAASDNRPTFLCRSDDLPDTAKGGDAGDKLTVNGVEYQVADLEPDGTGMTLIRLGR